MRIALVHPYSWPRTRRGGERYLHDLGWYLAGVGHDVEIITATDGADERLYEVIDSCPVQRAWKRPGPRVRRLPGVAQRLIEQVRIRRALDGHWDVVHTLWPAAAEAAAAAGHRVVYTLLGMVTAAALDENATLVAGIGRAARASHVRAALSDDAARHAAEVLGGDWIQLPPGLRPDRFPLHDAPRTGPPSFLFPGALNVPYKGLGDVLAAFADVRDHHPAATLRLAGPGDPTWALTPLKASTRARIEEGLIVKPAADDDELADLYARATATVLPARNEAFGLVVVESMSAGTPVVACDHGGPAEILDVPGVGARVRHGDVEALARAMLGVVDVAADAATPGRCAVRARAWDWDLVGPAHEEVYEALAAGRPIPPPAVTP